MQQKKHLKLNAAAGAVLLGAVAGGLALLAYASNEMASKAPPSPVVDSIAVATATTPAGEAMAHTCAACHGTLGRLGDESFVPLAGMPERQFTTSMVDFREGKRPATLMGHVAQGFNDAEIRAMAQFFAAVKPERTQP